MNGADSARKLLSDYNIELYRAFLTNDSTTLSLPEVSSIPWIGASKRTDFFEKKIAYECKQHQVISIEKNAEPHTLLWKTSVSVLKKAVRWGIVSPEAMTGKVIAALGQYRVIAHQRVLKGMESNTQLAKLQLLDIYQDRFEALEALERMINKKNSVEDYQQALGDYMLALDGISKNLKDYFSAQSVTGFDQTMVSQIQFDLCSDIARAQAYLKHVLENKSNLRAFHRSRGQSSIQEFVKEQMLHGLYELQGINQDLTYSRQRYFALTRGELNDVIENAKKEIEDYQPDPRNAVTLKHQGCFGKDKDQLVTYDFADEHLSPAKERDVLMAISFIEGWDSVSRDKNGISSVSNEFGTAKLDIFAATRWRRYRHWTSNLKSAAYFVLNIFKGIFVAIYPWEEQVWSDGPQKFHLIATSLRTYARPNEPMWRKPVRFCMHIINALKDVMYGVQDVGERLALKMPSSIGNDWASSKKLPSVVSVLAQATHDINTIKEVESVRLQNIIHLSKYQKDNTEHLKTSELAGVEYSLSAGEQNDILTAIARGLNGFGSIFSHDIFAKDPLGGLFFTASYAIGVAAIYNPAQTAAVFGEQYVKMFTDMSYSMASSKMAAAMAGGTTQAELFTEGWDGLMHGPSGAAGRAIYQLGENPLSIGTYFAAAFGLGYLLANGVDGYSIPWLSEYLRADLGSVPEMGYPVIGGKMAILFYEALLSETEAWVAYPSIPVSREGVDTEEERKIVKRFTMVQWLSINAAWIPKLASSQRFTIARQLDELFNQEEAVSLKKLLYPEAMPSIAFQLFSIPMAYVPHLLRFGFSFLLSFVALSSGNAYPWEPMRQAGGDLLFHVKKDLTRLVLFSHQLLNIPYTILSTFVKLAANIITLTLGRIGGVVNLNSGHTLHRMFAKTHLFFRQLSEFFYPVRLLKSVEFAHPNHTIRKVECSYLKLMSHLLQTRNSMKGADVSERSLVTFVSPAKQTRDELSVHFGKLFFDNDFSSNFDKQIVPITFDMTGSPKS
jgi:hypothetical protein